MEEPYVIVVISQILQEDGSFIVINAMWFVKQKLRLVYRDVNAKLYGK